MSPLVRARVALAAVLVLAALVRLVGLEQARGPAGFGPRLDLDGDPLYHAALAKHLATEGRVLWFDPDLDPPRGAPVVWPPLLDALVAGTAWLGAGGRPSEAAVDTAAAFVPVALGVLTVAVAGLLGVLLLGPGHGLLAALGLAVAPSAVFYTLVGRNDQHALELLLFLLAMAALAWAAQAASSAARRGRALLLGLAFAAAFWAWQGSAFTLLVLAAAAAVDHLAAPPGAPAARRLSTPLAEGALAGAALLAGSVLLLGPPGALRSGAITGVSGLGVAACLATALGAGLLAAAARVPRTPAVRVAEVLVAGGLAAAPLLAAPPLRGGIAQGLLPLRSASAWYGVIKEFQPLFFSDLVPATGDLLGVLLILGLTPILVGAGVRTLREDWREPDRRAAVVLLAATAAVGVGLWVARRRFELYAVAPLVLLGAAGARSLWTLAAARFGWSPRRATAGAAALVLVAAAPGAFDVAAFGDERDPGAAVVARVAGRLGAAVEGQGARPGVILCSWARGHHARFFSGLPALVTPFGSVAGPEAMTDWARVLLATDEAAAEEVLDARGVGWLLLEPLELDVLLAQRLTPEAPAAVVLDGASGALGATPLLNRLVAARLYWGDGGASAGVPALGGFRLVDEDAAAVAGAPPVKLFERVPGARATVTGAEPGARVRATVELRTPAGRNVLVAVSETADAAGTVTLRLPYAAGANGRVQAQPWLVTSRERSRLLAVPESVVLGGGGLTVALR